MVEKWEEHVEKQFPFLSAFCESRRGNRKVLAEHLPQCHLDSLDVERNELKVEDLSCRLVPTFNASNFPAPDLGAKLHRFNAWPPTLTLSFEHSS